MDNEQRKKFMRDLLKAWEKRDREKISQMYSPDLRAHMDGKTVYYNDIMNRLQYSIDHFKEVSNELQDLLVDGEKVVARMKQTLIGKIDGKPTIYLITAIYHIRDHKVLETWANFCPNVNYLKNTL